MSKLEESVETPTGRSQTLTFRVGDIITYQLSPAERVKAKHATEEVKYTAVRSFPQRVT